MQAYFAENGRMQTQLFKNTISVSSHQRRRPRRRQEETRLLLADALAVLKAMGAPRHEATASQYYGVRKRLSAAVRS